MIPDWTPNLVDDISLSDAEFREFQELVASLCGIHLSDAKRQLVKSRLQKRLRYHGLTSYRQYYNMVVATQDPEELTAFVNCITTNKTDFFREPHHFQYITECFIPDVLAQAERGVYPIDRVSTIPLHLLHKYFLRGRGASEGSVKVRDGVRELIEFKRINLNDVWPIRPDTRFDVIFCRNVIIYFNRETQRRLFARFADHLRPGGILFIGHSESLLNVSDAFVSLGNTIYQLPKRGW